MRPSGSSGSTTTAGRSRRPGNRSPPRVRGIQAERDWISRYFSSPRGLSFDFPSRRATEWSSTPSGSTAVRRRCSCRLRVSRWSGWAPGPGSRDVRPTERYRFERKAPGLPGGLGSLRGSPGRRPAYEPCRSVSAFRTRSPSSGGRRKREKGATAKERDSSIGISLLEVATATSSTPHLPRCWRRRGCRFGWRSDGSGPRGASSTGCTPGSKSTSEEAAGSRPMGPSRRLRLGAQRRRPLFRRPRWGNVRRRPSAGEVCGLQPRSWRRWRRGWSSGRFSPFGYGAVSLPVRGGRPDRWSKVFSTTRGLVRCRANHGNGR